ncbi:uncharacterized protein LOC134217892 isoform X1 [Armigeres subalbatus]|uniref:uncharacterized protein LOC134217892 isoform X1 n=1 Tax=Armigeres subalbatus TaxID=124917 RepID=UPI002ED03B36
MLIAIKDKKSFNMAASNVFESDSFNRKFVDKIVEYHERLLQGDEVSVWQQIALELGNNWELDCGDLRWQDLSRHFKRSLVFKLTHRKWIPDQGLIDRLQYPYLRKVYVVSIQFYEKGNTNGRTLSSSEIEENRLFIKYSLDGRYDPEVVAAFKRRSRKGSRVYVYINVGDPVYNLSDDGKKLLLQIEHHRKERPHFNADTNEKESSPVVLDGVPVAIEDGSPGAKHFSARDLLEKESFTVNTQEYDDIIKESLEREVPPVAKKPRIDDLDAVEIWLESNEILSRSSSIAVGSEDPLHISSRSEPERIGQPINIPEGSVSDPVFIPSSDKRPGKSFISENHSLTADSVQIKQESKDKRGDISKATSNVYDIFTDSEDEEEQILSKSECSNNSQLAIEKHVGDQRSHHDESVAGSNNSPMKSCIDTEAEVSLPASAGNGQPIIATEETLIVKPEPEDKKEVIPTTIRLNPAFNPYDIFTDSEDEDDDVDISDTSRLVSNSLIDNQLSEIDYSTENNATATEAPRNNPEKESPTVSAQHHAIQSEHCESDANLTISDPSNHSDDEASENYRMVNQIQAPIVDSTSETEQQTRNLTDEAIPPRVLTTAHKVSAPAAIVYRNSAGSSGFPVLNNSLESVPLHFIAKKQYLLTAAAESAGDDSSEVDNSVVETNETDVASSNTATKSSSGDSQALLINTPHTTSKQGNITNHSMETDNYSDLRTERFQINLHFGSQSPNLQVYMNDLRSDKLKTPIEPETSEPLATNVESPFSEENHDRNRIIPVQSNPSTQSSLSSEESNKLVITWSPKSTSNSSNSTQIPAVLSPPTATSPTGQRLMSEPHDAIRSTIETRLRFQAVLRSLWPELFARSGIFCDFQHLVSVLAVNIFPLLQPSTGPGAMALHRMVSPIACGLAYGYFEPNENSQTCDRCARNGTHVRVEKNTTVRRSADEDRTKNERTCLEAEVSVDGSSTSSGENLTTSIPTIILSDDDDDEDCIVELPVRTRRNYRLHQ